jgi:gamma-glutamyltranspeptidase / glutathione hydrolase
MRLRFALILALCLAPLAAQRAPAVAPKGMVVSQEAQASGVGAEVLKRGGNAVDAAVATAFALAVTHPAAGNLGGGGFLLLRLPNGRAEAYDFREMAPGGSSPEMFLMDGRYDEARHHDSYLSVGVPGTVAGLHRAWKEHGKLPWKSLLAPAIRLAREGFTVTETLARSLASVLPDLRRQPAALAQFSREGEPLRAGDLLRQADLARSLERISRSGPRGFYRGETARLLVQEVRKGGGIMSLADLAAYRVRKRIPLQGTYRGFQVLAYPPPSSGGQVLLQTLNVLEGYDLARWGRTSPETLHVTAEALKRAFADRAQFLGDPDFVKDIPLQRLLSKGYAEELRQGIHLDRTSPSDPERGILPPEHEETTHLSVVDADRGAVSLTYTLENSYGLRRVVTGAGFLLNDEMGDFNAGPGLTDRTGLIGTAPNLAQPGKRMLSSMCPVILAKDGRLALVSGSPGGRTIPSTVLWTLLGVVDFGLDAQAAVDGPRLHHQWFPDEVWLEAKLLPPTTLEALKARGHVLKPRAAMGIAQMIRVRADGSLEGGADSNRYGESLAVGH